ncbi:ABC transporter ATP-binding protein [Pararhodobacter zhoushanensis]|uniref:ABC transporter ATP-binding protein n=1 Tax=Pararhodobacter zhoushanensis TaxID=2479545 RepID=A0ABT3H538_9RHOB|nr:ABC transporter ATP-binding protein [Pararhodobacter zhoushanensis]MCW1934931.1 ABC transporter ATP-binding protein [Pararhodobacter zhoushanensis]
MTLLSVETATARHGLLTAVNGVSLTLDPGEVVCLIGANGAGKTTLMRAIAGAHVLAHGQILLNGQDMTALPTHRRVRAGIALSPEGRRLFPEMTLRENLRIAAENGRRGDWTLERVLAAFPQLAPLIDLPTGGFSGGQRQAAAIGRALMANPDVLLLDEVSLGLSPAAVEGVYASLTQVRAAGRMAMLVVEQDLTRALAFADRVICMAEGRAVLAGRPSDLTRAAITRAYFGLTEDEVQHV